MVNATASSSCRPDIIRGFPDEHLWTGVALLIIILIIASSCAAALLPVSAFPCVPGESRMLRSHYLLTMLPMKSSLLLIIDPCHCLIIMINTDYDLVIITDHAMFRTLVSTTARSGPQVPMEQEPLCLRRPGGCLSSPSSEATGARSGDTVARLARRTSSSE